MLGLRQRPRSWSYHTLHQVGYDIQMLPQSSPSHKVEANHQGTDERKEITK